MNEKNEQIFLGEEILAKSNLLINSKFKTSLNCQKVMYSALFKIQEKQYMIDAKTSEIVVEMPAAELIGMLGLKRSGTIYKTLEPIAQQMVNTTMGMSNPEDDRFEYMALITDAKYEDGIFTATFNSRLQNMLVNLQNNFTKLPRQVMMSWRSIYSYRLYEILRQRAYYPRNYTGPRNGIFSVTYDVYELKLLLGVVNSNLDAVQRVLKNTNPPDYRKACEASPERLYDDWNAFKQRVIDGAKKEINSSDISEIEIDYKTKYKKHKEVYAVEFTVYLKELYQKNDNNLPDVPVAVSEGSVVPRLSEMDRFILQMEIMSVLDGLGLSASDMYNICDASSYDVEAVRKAVNILKHSGKKIENVTGWLISAIQHSYEMPVSKEPETKPSQKRTGFGDFEQQDIDFEELEKRIRAN